ncbi:hypothetical protein BUALT_Bualt07G0093600 [Buddleja alternifolia]|uniref:Uncharacterized protein n=1 Tax=Buddleja alternifolia TaxID=168488 RepID=A0AAV6XHI7_9LAMI|nr:hypothetical protein BUALT_Bualt07G0093600 [Buddleja alternifolia]
MPKLQGTFSPKVYKRLKKSGYDFSTPSGLGKLEPELTGKKIHGLTKAQHKLRKQSTPTACPSILGRLGCSSRIPNVHGRLGASSIPQSSVFNRLGGGST